MSNHGENATIGDLGESALRRLIGQPIWKLYAPKVIVTPDGVYAGPLSIPTEDGSWVIIDAAGALGMNELSVHLSDQAAGLESQPDGVLNIIALGEDPRTLATIRILLSEHHVPGGTLLFMDCGLLFYCQGDENPSLGIVAGPNGVRVTTSPERNEQLSIDYEWRDLGDVP